MGKSRSKHWWELVGCRCWCSGADGDTAASSHDILAQTPALRHGRWCRLVGKRSCNISSSAQALGTPWGCCGLVLVPSTWQSPGRSLPVFSSEGRLSVVRRSCQPRKGEKDLPVIPIMLPLRLIFICPLNIPIHFLHR